MLAISCKSHVSIFNGFCITNIQNHSHKCWVGSYRRTKVLLNSCSAVFGNINKNMKHLLASKVLIGLDAGPEPRTGVYELLEPFFRSRTCTHDLKMCAPLSMCYYFRCHETGKIVCKILSNVTPQLVKLH